MSIGIVTYYNAINEGAFLQAYCLKNFIESCSTSKVYFVPNKSADIFSIQKKQLLQTKNPRLFWVNLNRIIANREAQKAYLSIGTINKNYDIVVVGSDEMWNEKNKAFKNSLDKLLPQKLIPVIIKLSEIDENKQVNSITKEERLALVRLLKCFEVHIKNFRKIEDAIITSGGINIKEINPKTMESKLVSGLFFAGEVIDVDCYTGGFNLQIAWSTGYLAGMN